MTDGWILGRKKYLKGERECCYITSHCKGIISRDTGFKHMPEVIKGDSLSCVVFRIGERMS